MTLDKIISNRVKGWSDAAHLREEILSWFKEQLPKEKADGYCENLNFQFNTKQFQAIPKWSQDKIDGYNQCLQDTLTNLTAKQGER